LPGNSPGNKPSVLFLAGINVRISYLQLFLCPAEQNQHKIYEVAGTTTGNLGNLVERSEEKAKEESL